MNKTTTLTISNAFSFVFTLGIVNLFADMTYEGGASINGQFLGSLGASAATVSIIAGVGEFFGYSLRAVAGYVSDKTGKYWLITFIGYAINLLAVPAMVFAETWQVAAGLILLERIGRAIRKPTIEAMLSYTTGTLGKGWVFGLNTALDETGATLGPLLMALVLALKGTYRLGFGILLVTSLLALAALTVARIHFPRPADLEAGPTAKAKGFSKAYWLSMIAAAFFAAGLMSFEFISSHLSTTAKIPESWIPIFVAIATVMSIIASLVLGKLYDKIGMPVVIAAIVLSACFSPFVFLGEFYMVLFGMLFWGIGYAMQDTLLKAIIAELLPEGRRSSAFGLFYIGYGVGWLVGSIVTGFLYERSIPGLIAYAIIVQLTAAPIFLLAKNRRIEKAS